MKKKNLVPTGALLAGILLVIYSIASAGDIMQFWDVPSIQITIGGSFAALAISFPFKTLANIPSTLKLLLVSPQDNRQELIKSLADMSRKARKDGLLALEDDIAGIDNEFLATGLQLVIDGMEPEDIRSLMELKMDTLERRHSAGQTVFLKWAELAPAFGMLGTLIGLIIMLAGLDDPSSIGSGMATALVTTFYGSFLANMIFIPIASNLQQQTEEEVFTCQMIVDGILEIQAGTNPRLLEEKLFSYLSPKEHKKMKESLESGIKEAAYNE